MKKQISIIAIICMMMCVACNTYDNKEGPYITAEEYIELYNIDEESLPKEYIVHYLSVNKLTVDELDGKDTIQDILNMYNSRINKGFDINDLTAGKHIFLTENDNLSDVTHIILRYEESIEGTEFVNSCLIVIDAESNKYYYDANEWNYTDAGANLVLSEDAVNALRLELSNIVSDKWENPEFYDIYSHIWWNLYLIRADGTVYYYKGCDPDEEGHPGFHDWFVKVQNLAEE